MAWLKMLRMWLKSGTKVKAKARRAAPRLRPGVELLETRTLMNSPPTLAAIPDQTFIARQGLVTVTLVGSDADNDPLTYSGRALLMGTAYQLDQQLGLSPMSAYYMNFQGHNEKWLQGNDAQYCVLPNGELRRWRDTAYTYGPAGLVATLDSTFWTDPSRLWDAKPAPTLTVQGNQLTIDPAANFVGSFQVEASVSDGQASASRVFTVIVTNSTPVLGTIADQSMPTTQDTLTLTLTGTDADSDPLTFSGRYADAAVPALAYQLDQQLGLSYMGSYYTDFQGNAEKWLQGAKGQYFILPNGELRLWWNQLYSYGAQGLVAKLNPNYYADPSLLWNARSVPAIGLPVKAYNLDQQLGLSYTGSYYTNFQGHNEKWLQGTSGQYLILPNGEVRLWQNAAYTYGPSGLMATLDASFYADPSKLWNAAAPATVSVSGNQLTIDPASGFTGTFMVEATASDGWASHSRVFFVSVVAGNPVVANAGPDNSANEGASVSFSGSATGGSGTGYTYAWTFGDGGTATGASPNHAFSDNGTYTVTLTVTDSLGASGQDTAVVTVSNVAPTATLSGGTAVNEGSAATISFSNQSDPSSADTSAGFKYSYDFNNDGIWDLTDVTQASRTNTFNDNGTYTVRGRIKDKDGSFTDYTATVTVNNVAPTASLSGGSAVNEGSAATISFSSQSDPSSADTSAGFKYSYDFNNDGTWDLTDVTQASRTNTFNDNGTYTVRGRIKDKDGGFSDYTATVTVNNVAPTPLPGGPYSGNPGTAIAFTGNATDPSSVDTAAGFTYAWNFGDGGTSNLRNPSYTYATAGTYTVTLAVTDKDNGSKSATTTASVTTSTSSFPNNLNPPPLPPPSGTLIHVSTVTQLQNAVANLASNQTILIDPGTYNLTGTLYLPQNLTNVAIRGTSGNVNDVVIKGAGMSGAITYGIWAGNVQGLTIGDLTIRDFATHGIILNAGVQSPLIHNVHIIDTNDQFIKSNPDGLGGGVNNGVVEYCTMEYTTYAPDTYTNGVDVHTGANWIIRDNVFRNIRALGGLAGPAILMWNGSRNTIAEGNTFIDCQREIAFGLDSTNATDHSGGIIRNNFIKRAAGTNGDVAIGVWNSANTQVLNNTVIINGDYANAIEYRFAATTGVVIKYNLTDAAIVSRDGATGTVLGNVTNAQASWFVNAAAGDLHLVSTATAAIDKALPLANVTTDYDGQARGSAPDVGADEF